MTSLDGIDVEYALKFAFQASNIEAKYKAVIAELNLVDSFGPSRLFRNQQYL